MKTFCNITGIEFEARSKRQKNHPIVSRLLNDLYKYESERYSAVKKALISRKGTFNSIEEIAEFIENYKETEEEEIFPEDTHTDIEYY